jgi:hypothetical protein
VSQQNQNLGPGAVQEYELSIRNPAGSLSSKLGSALIIPAGGPSHRDHIKVELFLPEPACAVKPWHTAPVFTV